MPPALIAVGTFLGAGTGAAAGIGSMSALAAGSWAVGGAVALGAYVGVSGSKSSKARDKAQAAADETQRQQEAEVKKLEDQQAEIEAGEERKNVRDEARLKQKKRASAASGRRSTILTDPLGDTSQVSSTKKTLIGD